MQQTGAGGDRPEHAGTGWSRLEQLGDQFMTDVLSREQRSFNMSRIRSAGTRPEEQVRKYLFARGLRYRKNVRALPGCPDLVFKKYRTVVFVHGCFWHHHNCRYFVWPSSNREFWRSKISGNEARDARNLALLQQQGWRVFIIWECPA